MIIGEATNSSSNPHHYHGPYPGSYDRTNPSPQDWLLWWLDKLEVPFSKLDTFGDALDGREVAHLDVLIAKYRTWQRRLVR